MSEVNISKVHEITQRPGGHADLGTAHCDGSYVTPDGKECSYFTLHLYLNDAPDDMEGGATIFHDWTMTQELRVEPKAGRVLLFQHRDLLHSGGDVLSGVKYTVRTDIMYRKDLEA